MFIQKNQAKYPILAFIAKDYLGCLASSAIVEREFSASGDVSMSSRGGLKPRTMEQSVSSKHWLKEGVDPGKGFSEAAKQI